MKRGPPVGCEMCGGEGQGGPSFARTESVERDGGGTACAMYKGAALPSAAKGRRLRSGRSGGDILEEFSMAAGSRRVMA